ncbi:MAG: acyl--CoA ligase [Alphaproteobacteria bacterium]|nr:acyl--CoA ligase [Alphaproteobacteria bacterium]
MNLADALSHHVRARPDRPAIIQGDRQILYRDLDGIVRRGAAHLDALGIGEGEVVGIALRDSIDHLLALYMAARRGAIALPLDWRWTEAEKRAVAERFHAKLILIEPDATPLPGIACVPVDMDFQIGVAAAREDMAFPSRLEAPLLLSLSSGTTGRPKGPIVTHGQFLRRFWTHWIDLGLNARETYVSATPMYFGGGRTFSMSLLFSGGTVVLFPPPYEARDLAAEVAKRKASSAFLVPTLLRRLLDLSDAEAAPLRAMRLLLSSGAPLHPEERREIRTRLCPNFCEYYASTEGGGVSLLRPEDMDVHDDSVGRPVFGVEVAIFDDDFKPLPAGAVGRLGYRGPGVASGFHEDPEATREVFHDGWFFPGDLASVNDAGYVFLKGRKKDMIIRGGINIYPVEVEAALQSDSAVVEAAVVGWPSRDMGEEVAAFVVLRAPAEPEALRKLCAARLAPYKVPKAVFVVDEMPKNAAGKIVKAALAERLPKS